MVDSKKGVKREQELEVRNVSDPREALTDENRALLTFFAAEVARYLELGLGSRLEQLELEVRDLGSRPETDLAPTIREIFALFSKYKLFKILRALSKMATEEKEFTKNTLLRRAGVGQGFRGEGLDRLIDIMCYRGFLMEVGRRGRGTVYRATGSGIRFFQLYMPSRSNKESFWD
jgi:hypothetical protein